MIALAIDAVLHGAPEGILGPGSDAGIGIRGDVGRIDAKSALVEDVAEADADEAVRCASGPGAGVAVAAVIDPAWGVWRDAESIFG